MRDLDKVEPKKLVATVKLFTGKPPDTLVAHGSHNQKDHGNRGAKSSSLMTRILKSGATIEPRSGRNVKTGYAVGLGDALKTPIATFKANGKKIMADWFDRKAEVGAFDNPDHKIGGWLDDGLVYLEPSVNIQNKQVAKKLGEDTNQMSIAHLVPGTKEQFIDTGGTGDYIGDYDTGETNR